MHILAYVVMGINISICWAASLSNPDAFTYVSVINTDKEQIEEEENVDFLDDLHPRFTDKNRYVYTSKIYYSPVRSHGMQNRLRYSEKTEEETSELAKENVDSHSKAGPLAPGVIEDIEMTHPLIGSNFHNEIAVGTNSSDELNATTIIKSEIVTDEIREDESNVSEIAATVQDINDRGRKYMEEVVKIPDDQMHMKSDKEIFVEGLREELDKNDDTNFDNKFNDGQKGGNSKEVHGKYDETKNETIDVSEMNGTRDGKVNDTYDAKERNGTHGKGINSTHNGDGINGTHDGEDIIEHAILGKENINDEKSDKLDRIQKGLNEKQTDKELNKNHTEETHMENGETDSNKTGRVIDIFSGNETFVRCTTPKGEPGHCTALKNCLLNDAFSSYTVFLQYVCLMRTAIVGICCPDNPVIEISDNTGNSTSASVNDIKQPDEGCGVNTNTRIVGGTMSVPHEWTWMVALLRRNRFFCGGVIINNWYVLTAAHCVLGVKVNDLKVRLGEFDFQEKHAHQEDIPVSEIKRHAQFVTLTFQNDIALLKLKSSVRFSKFIGSICLPEITARNYADQNATVVGWGTVSFGGSASPILRQVTIPVWANEDCDRTYFLESINDSFLCAGSPENGEDACQGDSGGPLMALNNIGRWEVIGIVSWGRRCGDPTYPGVYTRVTTYLDWIYKNSQ